MAGAANAADCGGVAALGENCFIAGPGIEPATFTLPDQFDTLVLQSGGEVAGAGVGILMNNDEQTVTIDSGGAVNTSGAANHGIDAAQTFGTINNAGSIATSGAGAHGIFADFAGDGHIIINNSGAIAAAGNGVNATTNYVIINNSGEISSTSGPGILVTGAYAEVFNSGAVSGVGDTAIKLTGENATLTLLAGTTLNGGIEFNNGLFNTLILGPGLSGVLTVDGTYTLEADGPYVINGNQLVVVDASGFSAHDEMLLDLTGMIATAVGNRLEGARQGMAGQATAMNGMQVIPVAEYGAETVAWASGLGAWRNESATGAEAGFDLRQGGVVAGLDGALGPDSRAGLFAGGALAQVKTEGGGQNLDAQSWFAGLYASTQGHGGGFLEVALAGGISRFDSARSVITINGTQRAEADYNGFFIAPTAKVGAELQMYNGATATPSLRARYAGLWLEGYSETGTPANLSFAGRDLHIFELRAEMAVAGTVETEGGALRNTLRLGVEGFAAEGDAVQATLLALPLSFDPNDEKATGRGFVGFDSYYTALGGSSLMLGAEAGLDLEDNFTVKANAGLYIPL